MKNYTKSNQKLIKKGGSSGAHDCAPRCASLGSAYLTRTNKSTSTSVKFRVVVSNIDDIIARSALYIKRLRSWLKDYFKGVVL